MSSLPANNATQLANVYNYEKYRYSCPCPRHDVQDRYSSTHS